MPERPDIELYCDKLRQHTLGERIEKLRIISPFLLRTFEPDIDKAVGKPVVAVRRLGKRVIFELPDELFLVIHLMIAGRFRWSATTNDKPPGKIGLASLHFPRGTLQLTEAGSKKRASLHVVQGIEQLAAFDRGGLDPLQADRIAFAGRLRCENHTLKRSLTDPHLFDGIGNAYSDEILHAAGLSPLTWTTRLNDEQIDRLFDATRQVLNHWIAKLSKDFANRFPGPGDITAFRPDFAVHGKFDQPCPVCETKVQRIRYADNETNYCPRCQTEGKVLADRSLSKLLKGDWPRTIEELEERRKD